MPCEGVGGERVDELKVDTYVLEPVDDRDGRLVYRSKVVSERPPLYKGREVESGPTVDAGLADYCKLATRRAHLRSNSRIC